MFRYGIPVFFCALMLSVSISGLALANSRETLPPKLWRLADTVYARAKAAGITDKDLLTLIDYSVPSSDKRLWVIDVPRHRVLFHTWVTHGEGSGTLRATHFSNQPETKASSVGVFLTGQTYRGQHGYSLRLHGLEFGFNDRAFQRAIVMHEASYAGEDFIQKYGRAGLSWGCPAIDPRFSSKIIDTIKQGTLVLAYAEDPEWLRTSRFLHDGKTGASIRV